MRRTVGKKRPSEVGDLFFELPENGVFITWYAGRARRKKEEEVLWRRVT